MQEFGTLNFIITYLNNTLKSGGSIMIMKQLIIWIATFLTVLGLNVFNILKIVNEQLYNRYIENKQAVTITILIISGVLSILFVITDKIASRRDKKEVVNNINDNTTEQITKMKQDLINELEQLKKIVKSYQNIEGLKWVIDGVESTDDSEVLKLLKQITLFYNTYKYKEANEEIEKGFALTMNPVDKIIFYNFGGIIYSLVGKNHDAEKMFNTMEKIIRKEKQKNGCKNGFFEKVEAICFGHIAIIHRVKGKLDKALEYHKKALDMVKKKGYKQGQATQLGNMGIVYREKGQLDVALEYYERALEIHKEIRDKQGQANDLGNIGTIYNDKRQLDIALNYYKGALEIHKEIEDKQGQSGDLGNIGLIYREKGMIDKALEYHERALSIDQGIGNKQGQSADLGNIGMIYSDKGVLDKALKYFSEALYIAKEIGYKQKQSIQLSNIGALYAQKGDQDKALEYLNRALVIEKEIGNKQGQAIVLVNIGVICEFRDDLNKALHYLEKALVIYNEYNLVYGKENCENAIEDFKKRKTTLTQ